MTFSSPSARSRYLVAAASIAMRRQPERPGLPFIGAKVKLDDVAATLGVTRTALYRRWETQHDFWTDLGQYLVFSHDNLERRHDLPWRAATVPALDVDHLPQMLEALRLGASAVQDALTTDLRVLVRASLFAYDDVPNVVAARRQAERGRIQVLAAFLFSLVDGLDRRFTDPLDAFGAAAALWCLADGLTVRSWRQPGLVGEVIAIDDGDGPKPWTLLGYAARVLIVDHTARGRLPADAATGTSGPPARAPSAVPAPRWSPGQVEALEAARMLFLERVDPNRPADLHNEVSALSQVTVASVARECRVTRRAVYNVWSSSDELRLDLLATLLRAEHRAIARRLEPVLAEPIEPDQRAGRLFDALMPRPDGNLLWVGHVRLAYLVDGRHPEVQRCNAAGTAALLNELRAAVGRLWPPGTRPSGTSIDDGQLALILSCLGDGATRLQRITPETVTGGGLRAMVDALVNHEPTDRRTARGRRWP